MKTNTLGITAMVLLLLAYWFIIGANDFINAMDPQAEIEAALNPRQVEQDRDK